MTLQQARRLQALLSFKEQTISQTVAAQVIGLSGTEHSRVIYLDKGSEDGIDRDMPVITSDGVVGKVLRVYKSTSQALLIDDQTSGMGTILEQSRLQGVLRGTASGEVVLDKIMNDEQVQPGEKVLTSGGDQIFPKGLLVGTVSNVSRGPESFLTIRVKPAADLGKLEEVLVITKKQEIQPDLATAPRAVDILSQRLPSVPDKATPPKTQEQAAERHGSFYRSTGYEQGRCQASNGSFAATRKSNRDTAESSIACRSHIHRTSRLRFTGSACQSRSSFRLQRCSCRHSFR